MNDRLIIQPELKNNLTAEETSQCKLLSTVTRVFDPLGLVASFVITLEILLQKLWWLGISWDQEVPREYIPNIEKWTRQCE